MNTPVTKRFCRAVAALAIAASAVPAFALGAPEPIESSRIAARVLSEANRYRLASGQAAVSSNDRLNRAAQQYADFLARNMRSGPGADGKSAKQRAAAVGYKVCAWGENRFEPNPYEANFHWQSLAERVVEYWKPYPGSNRNLLNPRARHIGVGVASWTHGFDSRFFKVVLLVAGPCS